jgi:tetratricopeptide (TPR) repeat protein
MRRHSLPEIDYEKKLRRLKIRDEITRHRLDELYYALLLSPEDGFGDIYYDLQEMLWQANDEDTTVMAQAELWRILENRLMLEFTNLGVYQKRLKRYEDPYEILYRAMKQEIAVRWMKLFIMHKTYNRVVEFYNYIEQSISKMVDPGERKSWGHTFSHGERLCWYGYALILEANPSVPDILKQMEQSATDLEKLVAAPTSKFVFPARDERGFIGHPAEPRMRRLLARYYNNIGYGYVSLGEYRKAVHYYSLAFKYMRETKFISQQATTRNNLARALAELGRQRARRVCLDALNLRKQLGHEIPIAYSYNTLALVDNRLGRPDVAWQEAATALAYFYRAGDELGKGLSLIQLGEALRRLANLYRHEERASREDIRLIYEEAKKALDVARDIFANEIKSPLRELEVLMERAAVERDLLSVVDRDATGKYWQQNYVKALKGFDIAVEKAHGLKLHNLELDTLINKAWAYYRGFEPKPALQLLNDVEENTTLIPQRARILPNQDPPKPGGKDSFAYYQLAKMYSLRGRIAMDRFVERTEQINQETANRNREERKALIHKDAAANDYLKEGAMSFTLALSYAQLFSIQSNALGTTFDALYNYLKKFNEQELADFNTYQAETFKLYRIKKVEPEDVGRVGEFLHECFGLEQ